MLYHRTKLNPMHSSFPSIIAVSCVLSCRYARIRTSKGCFRERKKRARYTEEKSSTNRLSAKCLVTAKCARAPLGRNQIQLFTRLYTSLPCKRLAVPFCIIARAVRRNEKQRVTRYKTKPLFFSLGTCRLSDSCSARVTLARVSSSCARDGEISISGMKLF